MENKNMIENFKKIITDKLTEVGLLVNENESIFSSEKIIQDKEKGSLMLVGPNKEAWIFMGEMLPEKDFNNNLNQFIEMVKENMKSILKNRVDINQNISLKTYLDGLAKLFESEAPTAKIGTTPLKDLVAQICKIQEEPKEDK